MSDQPQSIFRPDAVRRYIAGKERSVLPRLITPTTFSWLWLMVALLLIAAVIVLSFALPLSLFVGSVL